jgi:protein TonB
MDRLRMAWDKTLRISGSAMKDKAVEAPKPVYPVLARQQGIQGRVRVEVAVKPSGEVESVKALSGHPLLQQAAVDAVRKWRYVPTLYDGKPVSVITTVDFDFKLN